MNPTKQMISRELQQVQDIILEPDRKRLNALEDQIEILKQTFADNSFIEKNIEESLQKNRTKMIDLLYPILGSMVKKTVSEALKNLMITIDQFIEKSFSIEGFKWRIESWRTGVPLQKIALRETFVYKVEHILLVHSRSGRLLSHVVAPAAAPMDKNSFSGMLSAIIDFSKDVFKKNEKKFSSLEFSDFSILLAYGEDTFVAAVIRGMPQFGFRRKLEQALGKLQAEYGEVLNQLRLPETTETQAQEFLRPLLVEQRKRAVKPTRNLKGVLVISFFLLGLVFFAGKYVVKKQNMKNQELARIAWVSGKLDFNGDKKAQYLRNLSVLNGLELNIYGKRRNVDLVAKQIAMAYHSPGKKGDFVVVLSYRKGLKSLANRAAGELKWLLYQKGVFDYHLVRTREFAETGKGKSVQINTILGGST